MSLRMVNVYTVQYTVLEADVARVASAIVVRRVGREITVPLNVAGDATLLVNNQAAQNVNLVILENFAKSYAP